jgi:hypothetical protein
MFSALALAIVLLSLIIVFRLKTASDAEIEAFRKSQKATLEANLKSYADIAFKQIEANYKAASEKASIVKNNGRRLKNIVDAAYTVAQDELKRADAGTVSKESAKARWRPSVQRYVRRGYEWVTTWGSDSRC